MSVKIALGGLVLIALMVVLVVGFVLLLVSKKTRLIGLTLLVVPAVLVLLSAGMLFTYRDARSRQPATSVTVESDGTRIVAYGGDTLVVAPAENGSSGYSIGSDMAVSASDKTPRGIYVASSGTKNVRPGGVLWAVGHAILKAADSAKQRKENGETVMEAPVVTEEAPAVTKEAPALAKEEPASTDEGRPDWVDAEPHRNGHAFIVPISVGPFSTLSECEQSLPLAMQKAVDEYATKLVGAETDGSVRLPLDFLEEHVVKGQWEEQTFSPALGRDMHNLHVLMSFDREANTRLYESVKQTVVAGRLVGTAGLLVLFLLLLSIIYGYLKADLATGGSYRWRLRLVAGTMVLVLATGVILLVA